MDKSAGAVVCRPEVPEVPLGVLPPLPVISPAVPVETAASSALVRFESLLRQYDRLIRSIVARAGRRMGLKPSSFLVKDDIEQEVRLDLWKQVARGQTIDFPATYIYKATIRETLRAIRREMSRETVPIEEDGAAEQLKDVGDPFQSLAAKEQFREIIFGLHRLARDRQCAVRAHLTGFQFNEIMMMYGWSYQKARNLIARGMADLRETLNKSGEAPRPLPRLQSPRLIVRPTTRSVRPPASPLLRRFQKD